MQSHTYEITPRQLAGIILPVLVGLTACALILHLTAMLGWLPPKPATLYADETVLRHQARARRAIDPAQFVLVGDSTCHAAVDAAALSQHLPGRPGAINLALVIGIDLAQYAQTAAEFAEANPNQVRWVVLLISPARMAERGETWLWKQMCDESPPATPGSRSPWSLADISGGRLLRERLASWLLPQPLSGNGARQFGFTTGLDRYMTEHHGSVVDFGEMTTLPARTPAEFLVGDDFAQACRDFRANLPPGVKLAVGLTPVPALAKGPGTEAAYRRCLTQLNALLQPDALLTRLPVTQPTPGFSPSAHMNAVGQQQFTAALAKELARLP